MKPKKSTCTVTDLAITPPAGIEENDPHWLAMRYLSKYRHQDGWLLRFWREEFFLWEHGGYGSLTDIDVRCCVVTFVDEEFTRIHERLIRQYQIAKEKGDDKIKAPKKPKATSSLINDVLQALKGITHIPSSVESPSWLATNESNPTDLISAPNGIINIRSLVEHKPNYLHPPTRNSSR